MKRYILFFVAALTLVSCTEFLDIKPYGKEIPEDVEDFSALIHYICYDIDNGNTSGTDILDSYSTAGSTFEGIADNMEVNLTEYPQGSTLPFYLGGPASSSPYTFLYATIRTCNIVIGEMNEGRDTRAGMDLLGTAYAIRGVCYYQLLRKYCAPPLASDGQLGVPLVTEFDMEAKPVRSTMQETIAQVEEDLKTAIAYDIQEPMYRFNNTILHGYLARLYHWCGRWSEARQEAQIVLAKAPLISGTDYVKMLNQQFGLLGNKLIGQLYGSTLGMTEFYNTLKARPLSTRFISLFPEGDADIRHTFFFNAKRQNTKVCYAGMRSAEMALIAMESAYHLGDQPTALQELNDFRRSRISPYTDLTMTTLPAIRDDEYIKEDCYGNPLTPLLYNILVERRKELYMENGDRYFELKRNGRPEWWVMHKGLKYWNQKYMYTWPLPVEDIELQPDLIQNPGYDETM